MRKNENRKNRNRRNFVVLTLVCMLAATFVGCKESEAVTPEPSTSEVVSEPVSEPVSEEVSEPVSEEVSEEVVSEEQTVSEIEVTNFSNYNEFLSHLEKLNRTTIVVWGNEEQSILANGSVYELSEGENLIIYHPEKVLEIKTNVEYIEFTMEQENTLDFRLYSTGTEIEVPITVIYEDGTEETITVYITKEFKYEWE